jgi:hypothetical protein
MHHARLNTIILIATLALSTGAEAQKIYKCGNSYSQIACPDGVILPAVAAPDTARKKEMDQSTRRDALTADRMEKSRLKQEKRDLAANTPSIKRESQTSAEHAAVSSSLKKNTAKRKKEEFRAVVPGTMPPKKNSKKKTAA